MDNLDKIFKAYDVRGLYPAEINEDLARKLGLAFASVRKPRTVVVGQDVRMSGVSLKKSLIDGLLAAGVDVVDIGVITTDQLYFAVGKYGYDGGISVTASHNPGEYNGFKFAITGGAPPSSEDLNALKQETGKDLQPAAQTGQLVSKEILTDYIEHVLGYTDAGRIKPLKIVANANFGAVGRAVDQIANKLNLELSRLNWQEDGSFPKGPPNPLLPENRDETIAKIKSEGPDLGVAWDADADRCFFFGGSGLFIPSCYIVTLIAKDLIAKHPGAKVIHDLTTSWVIKETVEKAGGQAIANRTGHTFIKRRMRQEDALFAGESSGHYYFKNSYFADNGIVPFLLILEMVSTSGMSLEQLVQPLMDAYKVSGEINFEVKDTAAAVSRVEKQFASQGEIDRADGLVVESDQWRFSLRSSNTEPLLRLNAEARQQQTLDNLVSELKNLISPR